MQGNKLENKGIKREIKEKNGRQKKRRERRGNRGKKLWKKQRGKKVRREKKV